MMSSRPESRAKDRPTDPEPTPRTLSGEGEGFEDSHTRVIPAPSSAEEDTIERTPIRDAGGVARELASTIIDEELAAPFSLAPDPTDAANEAAPARSLLGSLLDRPGYLLAGFVLGVLVAGLVYLAVLRS